MKKTLYFILSFIMVLGLSMIVAFAEGEEVPIEEPILMASTLIPISEPSVENNNSIEQVNIIDQDVPLANIPESTGGSIPTTIPETNPNTLKEKESDSNIIENEDLDNDIEEFQDNNDDNNINVAVDIFVNNELEATDNINSEDYPEIEYGSVPLGYMYGDYYGELSKGEVYFNDKKGYCFTFDPENISILGPGYSSPTPEDVIQLNLYYIKEKTEEIVKEFGNVLLEITDGTDPVADYEVIFTGKKAAEIITQSEKSNEKGEISTQLDKSYNWEFDFNGTSYLIDEFDFYTQLSLSTNVHYNEPIVDETKNYKVSVTHYFCDEPGGTMIDNVPDNYTSSEADEDREFVGGTIINIMDYVRQVENYHLGATYVRGAGAYDSKELTIADDYIVSIVYVKDPEPIPEPIYYSVTYKDGEEILSNFPNCLENSETPTFNIDILTKDGFTFIGWSPEVAPIVTADAIYQAQWQQNSRPHRPHNPDPKPDPDPIVDPDPTPTPDPEPIDISDEPTPLTDLPDIDIPEEPIPLADEPIIKEPVEINNEPTPTLSQPAQTTTIEEQPVPLAVLPQTGDMTKPWALGMFISGFALLVIGYYGKRKEG